MAKKRKTKTDRNEGLSAAQIFKRRLLKETVLVWLVIFYVLFVVTVTLIQAGPFKLSLSGAGLDSDDGFFVVLVSSQILGGFSLLWMFVAVPFAVFYYRFMNKRRCPKKVEQKQETQISVPLAMVGTNNTFVKANP